MQQQQTTNKITVAQAVQMFSNIASSFVSLETETDQDKLNTTNGKRSKAEKVTLEQATGIAPKDIRKTSKFVGLVGTDIKYEDLVNNRLFKEAVNAGKSKPQLTFSAQERKWGTRVNGAIVEHKGEFYLTVLCVANNKPIVEYSHQGQPINLMESRFDDFRAKPSKAPQNQGTQNPVIYKEYKISSIKRFTMNHKTYEII